MDVRSLRINFAATTFEGKLYVVGGEGLKGVLIQTVEAYDPTIDRWKEAGALTKPRRHHAVCTTSGKLWSCGGASSLLEAQSTNELVLVNTRVVRDTIEQHSSIFCSTVDPHPEEWRRSLSISTLPDPRQEHCLAAFDNTVLLFGGE